MQSKFNLAEVVTLNQACGRLEPDAAPPSKLLIMIPYAADIEQVDEFTRTSKSFDLRLEIYVHTGSLPDDLKAKVLAHIATT